MALTITVIVLYCKCCRRKDEVGEESDDNDGTISEACCAVDGSTEVTCPHCGENLLLQDAAYANIFQGDAEASPPVPQEMGEGMSHSEDHPSQHQNTALPPCLRCCFDCTKLIDIDCSCGLAGKCLGCLCFCCECGCPPCRCFMDGLRTLSTCCCSRPMSANFDSIGRRMVQVGCLAVAAGKVQTYRGGTPLVELMCDTTGANCTQLWTAVLLESGSQFLAEGSRVAMWSGRVVGAATTAALAECGRIAVEEAARKSQ